MSSKQKILVIDDNEEFCQNVADILEQEEYTVVTAYNGFEGLELVTHDRFGMVLMDVRMPVMDGVQTFKKVKGIVPDTPVIMVTAYAVEDLLREALREGAFGVLKKPVDFDKLVKLIERATPDGDTILVVDDDEARCSNMKEVLSAKGYRVCVAYDGDTAVEKVRESNFDIMLIDVKLNAVNGLETYLSIRDFRPEAVVIIITDYEQETNNLVQQALQGTVYTCLEKPINMDELIALLERIREEKNRNT